MKKITFNAAMAENENDKQIDAAYAMAETIVSHRLRPVDMRHWVEHSQGPMDDVAFACFMGELNYWLGQLRGVK